MVSDSIMNNIDEKRLSRTFNTKVRYFSGTAVEDTFAMFAIKKRNRTMFCYILGRIIAKILKLKKHIETVLPNATVTISQPIVRMDDTKASLTVRL